MATLKRKAFATVDEYLAAQPETARIYLEQIRKLVQKMAPQAEELISYQIPAFRWKGMLLWYAGFKNHIGIYPTAATLEAFSKKLSGYRVSKGTLQLPLDQPLPQKLLAELIAYRIKINQSKEV